MKTQEIFLDITQLVPYKDANCTPSENPEQLNSLMLRDEQTMKPRSDRSARVKEPHMARSWSWSLVRGGRTARIPCSTCLFFFLCLLVESAIGQQPSLPRELLLFIEVPTVVTATGREQPLTKAPSAITVITAEEIRQSGATSLPELLRSAPGLDFFRTSASNVSIAARGLNQADRARIQVLIDGLSVYEDVETVIYWHQIPIPLEEIERIEIVRSPATALHGDKAFAGVVHIITKPPEALKGTHVSGTAGDAGAGIGNLIHAGVRGNLSYKVSLGYDRVNQFPNPALGRTSDELGRADTRGHFQVNYKLAEGSKVSLSGGIDEFDRREILAEGPFRGVPFRGVTAGSIGFVKANYALGDFKVQLSYNRGEANIRSQSFPEAITGLANVYQAQLQHSLALGHTNILTGGITYRFVSLDSPGFSEGGQDQHLPAFFLQDEWNVREDLTLTMGVGVDIHPEAGVSASPRGSLVYSPWKDHTFRISVAKAFRNPSLLENFEAVRFQIPAPPQPSQPQTIAVLGNTALRPEEMLSYEVGYQTLLFERLRVRIDLFYNQLDQLITARLVQTGVQFINIEDGEIYGGELGFDVFIASWLKGFLNYSYQERTGDISAMGFASHHKGNAGLTFSFAQGLSATVLVHHVGKLENRAADVNPYTIVNVRLGYQFKLFGNETELAIQAFNLFNDVHREFPGGDLIERRVSGTLRYRF